MIYEGEKDSEQSFCVAGQRNGLPDITTKKTNKIIKNYGTSKKKTIAHQTSETSYS